jgi:hypothetical protein
LTTPRREEEAVSTGEFDRVDKFSSLSLLHAYRAVSAVVSDDHNFDRGVETARAVARTVLTEQGPDGLAEVTVELSLKLAEALERIAAEHGVAATDLAEVWFVG